MMPVKTRTNVINPANYRPEDVLPAEELHLSDWSRLCLEIILRRQSTTECEGGFVRIHSGVLQDQIQRRYSGPILKRFKERGVIEVDGSWQAGNYSQRYKVKEPYASSELVTVALTHAPVITKALKNRKLHDVTANTAVEKALYSWLEKAQFDAPAALEYVKSLGLQGLRLNRRILDILNLQNRQFYFIRHGFGRIFHNVSNLASKLRQFLSFNGKRLGTIDIANAQPLFLTHYILSNTHIPFNAINHSLYYDVQSNVNINNIGNIGSIGNSNLPDDLVRWRQLTETGELYSNMMKNVETHYRSAKAFKKAFIAQCLYYNNHKSHRDSKLRAGFRKDFPSVANVLDFLKKDNHANAACEMQRLEAKFIYEGVCQRLITESPQIPLLVIHDCVMTTGEHMAKVKRVFEEEFKGIGLRATLREIPPPTDRAR